MNREWKHKKFTESSTRAREEKERTLNGGDDEGEKKKKNEWEKVKYEKMKWEKNLLYLTYTRRMSQMSSYHLSQDPKKKEAEEYTSIPCPECVILEDWRMEMSMMRT